MSGAAAARERAELLKAEAERLLNVDCQRSLEIADQIRALGADSRIQALAWLARADALRELGRHAQAMDAYQTAASLYRQAGDAIGWARTRIGATLTCRYTGTHVTVLADLDEARAILAEHGLWLRLARLETFSGVVLAALGRADEALAAHQRALHAAGRLDPPNDLLEAEVLGNLAITHYQVDDYAAAESVHARAVAIFEREGQREHVARSYRNYARFAAGRGQYSAALAAAIPGRQALIDLGRTDAAAHLGQVAVDCLVRLNRAAEAATLAERVADEFESLGANVDAGATRGLGALALARLGHQEAALAQLDAAAALFEAADWDAGRANVALGRAVILGETDQWARALEQASAIRDDLLRRGLIVRTAEADLVRGRALRALGHPEAAAAAAHAALEVVHDRGLAWLTYQAWRLLGELAREAGDRRSALDALLRAVADLEQVQGRILTEYRASFLADKVDVYEAAVELLLDDASTEQAFELVERSKSRALVDVLAGGLDIRVRVGNPRQASLADELARLRREHAALVEMGTTPGVPDVRALERQIGVVLEELHLAGAGDLERLALIEGRVYSPQHQLGPSTAVLEFSAIGPDLAVFVLDAGQVRHRRIAGGLALAARLRQMMQLNLEAAMAAPERRRLLEAHARAVLGRLYDVLVRPVADWLEPYQRLVVVPHGPLHQVPFSALFDGTSYVVERFEVVTAPSASALTFCMRPRARDGQRALVVGHSAGGALPGARDEARAVGELFESDCLLESEATSSRLRELAGQADVLHLAAHGVSRTDAPLFSSLRLADGPLTALDCFDLDLDCSLVALSACESGRGAVTAGDEQIGLPRAFLYAGARAVLHTLWRIDDQATRATMTDFYRYLRAGHGRGAALRLAQQDALRSRDAHPFFWAGFVLVGDWR